MEIIDELEPVKRGPVRRRGRLRRLLAATSTPRSPSAPWSSARRPGVACRPARASSPTAIPDDEDLECRNKAAALLAAVPAARRMTVKRAEEGTPA